MSRPVPTLLLPAGTVTHRGSPHRRAGGVGRGRQASSGRAFPRSAPLVPGSAPPRFCSLPLGRVRPHALPLAFGGRWGTPRWWERCTGPAVGGGPAHLTFNSGRPLLAAQPPPPLSANLGGWRTRGRGAGPQQRQTRSAQAPALVFDFSCFGSARNEEAGSVCARAFWGGGALSHAP